MLLQLSQLLTHGAAMLDFELGVLGGCPSSELGNPSSEGAFLTLTSENPTSKYKWNALLQCCFLRLQSNAVILLQADFRGETGLTPNCSPYI